MCNFARWCQRSLEVGAWFMAKGPFQLKLINGREQEFGRECSFQVESNGILKIFDTQNRRQITYSPGGWLSVESELPDQRH